MKQTMKQLLCLCCVLLLSLTGCTSNQSTVKFVKQTDQEKKIAFTTADAFGIWDFSFQDDIQGIALSIDVWEYGKCTDFGLFYNGSAQDTKACYISMKTEYTDQSIESQWQWLRDMGVGTAKTSPIKRSIPLTEEYSGWTYHLGNDEELMVLEPGESYVLAVQNYDLKGDGMGGACCRNLKDALSSLATEEYVIVLRLQTFATQEEAENIGKKQLDSGLALLKV